MPFETQKRIIDYYIFIDYSEMLVGYIIIQKEKIQGLLPRISKLHHYKDIKHKKAYIKSISQKSKISGNLENSKNFQSKKVFEKNKIDNYLLKFKSKELKDNLSIYVDIIDFVKQYNNCKIFISVDNNQFIAFTKLLGMIPHKDHITIFKESDLKKGSVEYSLSLIIDTKLNIERIKIMSK